MQTTKLIPDSRTVFHVCSTTKDSTEMKNKSLLASIRDKYHSGSMATIRWATGQSHLANALAKNNQEIAMTLDKVLTSRFHDHTNSSYDVIFDVSTSRGGFETILHAQKSNNKMDSATIPASSEEIWFVSDN